VNGAGQDQPGELRHLPLGDEILDLRLRLLLDPIVDELSRGLGILAEINLAEAALYCFREMARKASRNVNPLCPIRNWRSRARRSSFPHRDRRSTWRRGCGRSGRPGGYGAGMELLPGHVEVKHLGHLRGGVLPGPGVRHGKCREMLLGREEEIPLGALELRVEIEGEGRVGVDDIAKLAAGSLAWGRTSNTPCLREPCRERHRKWGERLLAHDVSPVDQLSFGPS